MVTVLKVIYSLFLIVSYVHCQCKIDTFHGVFIIIAYSSSPTSTRQIEIGGCIEPGTVALNVISIQCNSQNVPILYRGAVSNLGNLQSLTFFNDNITKIQPGAFLNLKRLKHLEISDNPLEALDYGVFNGMPTEILEITHNKISSVAFEAFANMVYLRIINMNHNELPEWDPKWFRGTPSLEEVHFENNNIEQLRNDAFRNFRKLKVLNFRKNKIVSVHKNVFDGLFALTSVDVSDNRLKILHQDLFSNLKVNLEVRPIRKSSSLLGLGLDKIITDGLSTVLNEGLTTLTGGLESLHLHGNNLTYIPEKMLQTLEDLKHISIHSNPWQCACYFKILKWSHNNHKEVNRLNFGCISTDNPVCVVSSVHPHDCLEDINDEEISWFRSNFEPVDDNIDARNVYCA